jgi:hypothetical protein
MANALTWGDQMDNDAARVLVVGRSPSVLERVVEMLREAGYRADVTNQFGEVLDDYDAAGLDVLVFGGMVPPDTKQFLREEVGKRNASVTVVQGMVGIPGVLAAQVDAATRGSGAAVVEYDEVERTIRLELPEDARVTVEAFWMTSWTPPEPSSTSSMVFEDDLAAGSREVVLPERVPGEAAFVVVRVGGDARVFAIGSMPQAVTRMVPKSAADQRLPEVAQVSSRTFS